MGVNSDLLNPKPFQLGGTGNTQARIRQQANNARAKGLNQVRAFKQLTETGGIQAQQPEVSSTAESRQTALPGRMTVAAAEAGEKLRTHRKLIDNLVNHIMFG